MDAVILGGAENSGSLKKSAGARYEAQIEITGRPMIDFVVAALDKLECIDRVVVVAAEEVAAGLKGKKIWKVVSPGPDMVESLHRALQSFRGEGGGYVLVLSSDIPLITVEALRDFLQQCQEREADIYYSLVPRQAIEERFAGVQRTYVRLKDGTFTGGNVVLINPEAILSYSDYLRQAIQLRKHPLKLCRLLGIKFFLKFLAGRLTVSEIEVRVEELIKLKGAGVVSLYPEIGIDVDKPSDLQFARAILEQRPTGL
jgi:GTP:adenosylcobinamide-phosphate guanylyltransferase